MVRWSALFPISAAVWLVFALGLGGCGSPGSEFGKGQRDASISSDGPVLTLFTDGPGLVFGDAPSTGDDAAGGGGGAGAMSVTIQPQNPEIDVSIVNGQIVAVALAGDAGSASPLIFTAIANG